jgi:hypothetical protein
LKAFGRIEATTKVDGKVERDVRIFALSHELAPQALLDTLRAHWDIENGLHWQLDVLCARTPRATAARMLPPTSPCCGAELSTSRAATPPPSSNAQDGIMISCYRCSVICDSPAHNGGGERASRM